MEQSRSDILSQLAAGSISAAQAAEQLRGGAVPPVPPLGALPPVPPVPPTPLNLGQRWLRIRVTDLNTGRPRVNVNLPLSWVAAGLRLGAAHHGPKLDHIDLAQLLHEVEAGGTGQLIDVEDLDDGERVQIFVD